MKLRDRISVNKQYEIYKLLDWIDINKLNWTPGDPDVFNQNLYKINWNLMSRNPAAIQLLEQNQDKINWYNLSENPSIFTYNYKELKLRMKETIAEDLMKNRFHPKYIDKWIDWGQVEADDFT